MKTTAPKQLSQHASSPLSWLDAVGIAWAQPIFAAPLR